MNLRQSTLPAGSRETHTENTLETLSCPLPHRGDQPPTGRGSQADVTMDGFRVRCDDDGAVGLEAVTPLGHRGEAGWAVL